MKIKVFKKEIEKSIVKKVNKKKPVDLFNLSNLEEMQTPVFLDIHNVKNELECNELYMSKTPINNESKIQDHVNLENLEDSSKIQNEERNDSIEPLKLFLINKVYHLSYKIKEHLIDFSNYFLNANQNDIITNIGKAFLQTILLRQNSDSISIIESDKNLLYGIINNKNVINNYVEIFIETLNANQISKTMLSSIIKLYLKDYQMNRKYIKIEDKISKHFVDFILNSYEYLLLLDKSANPENLRTLGIKRNSENFAKEKILHECKNKDNCNECKANDSERKNKISGKLIKNNHKLLKCNK